MDNVLLLVCCLLLQCVPFVFSGSANRSCESLSQNLDNDCNFNYPYRTMDGSCNNKLFTSWGKIGTSYSRLLKARYAGVSFQVVVLDNDELPKAVNGKNLPNSRGLNINLFNLNNEPSSRFSLAAMQIGQFIAHDIALSLEKRDGSTTCCPGEVPVENSTCASVFLSSSDPFYSFFNQQCMNIFRVKKNSLDICHSGAQPSNAVTHFLDLSQVYGSSDEVIMKTRLFRNGLLKTNKANGFDFPPCSKSDGCKTPETISFQAGDLRVNQNPGLMVLHVLFLREHNRVARILKKFLPEYDDEKLFQETRRIVIAEYQNIIYNEWLPNLFGINFESMDDLNTNYDENVNPSVINEFTAGCFRSLHSMIQGELHFTDEKGKILSTTLLRDAFNKPSIVIRWFDNVLLGLTKQASAELDSSNSEDIVNYLLKGDKLFGKDLITVDIQRGRDHGLPSYNSARKLIAKQEASIFSEYLDVISYINVRKLMKGYKSPNDVDLLVATQFENKFSSSILGPTCQAIVTEQFLRLMIGDRFFFTHADQIGSFSKMQQNEFRKSSFARLACDNGNNIKTIQKEAFLLVNKENPIVSCSDLPSVSLLDWPAENIFKA